MNIKYSVAGVCSLACISIMAGGIHEESDGHSNISEQLYLSEAKRALSESNACQDAFIALTNRAASLTFEGLHEVNIGDFEYDTSSSNRRLNCRSKKDAAHKKTTRLVIGGRFPRVIGSRTLRDYYEFDENAYRIVPDREGFPSSDSQSSLVYDGRFSPTNSGLKRAVATILRTPLSHRVIGLHLIDHLNRERINIDEAKVLVEKTIHQLDGQAFGSLGIARVIGRSASSNLFYSCCCTNAEIKVFVAVENSRRCVSTNYVGNNRRVASLKLPQLRISFISPSWARQAANERSIISNVLSSVVVKKPTDAEIEQKRIEIIHGREKRRLEREDRAKELQKQREKYAEAWRAVEKQWQPHLPRWGTYDELTKLPLVAYAGFEFGGKGVKNIKSSRERDPYEQWNLRTNQLPPFVSFLTYKQEICVGTWKAVANLFSSLKSDRLYKAHLFREYKGKLARQQCLDDFYNLARYLDKENGGELIAWHGGVSREKDGSSHIVDITRSNSMPKFDGKDLRLLNLISMDRKKDYRRQKSFCYQGRTNNGLNYALSADLVIEMGEEDDKVDQRHAIYSVETTEKMGSEGFISKRSAMTNAIEEVWSSSEKTCWHLDFDLEWPEGREIARYEGVNAED